MPQYYAPNTWRWGGWKKPLWRRIRDFFDDTENTRSKKYHSQQDLKNSKSSYESLYPVIDITIPIPRFKFNFIIKTISIPIKTLSFSFNKKAIAIHLPKIKIDIRELKKIFLVFTLISVSLVLVLTAFFAWRVVSLTDGDYLGKTYLYKIDKFLEERVLPLDSSVKILNERVGDLEIKEESRAYKEQTNYKPVIKQYNIYDSKKTLIKTEIKE